MITYQDYEEGSEGDEIAASLPPFSTRSAKDDAFGVYTSDSIHGDVAARYDGDTSWSFHRILLDGEHHRVRAYVRRDSDPDDHTFILAARDSDDDDLAVVQVREDDHIIRHIRFGDYETLGDTGEWHEGDVWRLEYEVDYNEDQNETTVTLRVWSDDPESSGDADHTIDGTLDGRVKYVAIGNLEGHDLDIVWDSIAVSEGESIGPIEVDTPDPVDISVAVAQLRQQWSIDPIRTQWSVGRLRKHRGRKP